jgi:hypothetical protein
LGAQRLVKPAAEIVLRFSSRFENGCVREVKLLRHWPDGFHREHFIRHF